MEISDLFSPAGRKLIGEQRLDPPFCARVLSLLRLIDAYDFEIDVVTKRITSELKHHPGYQAIQAIPGVGPILAAIFVAEIGDITRFRRPEQLCSWAGMTPRHRESDTKVHRSRITKQGNNLVRWAAIEAIQRVHYGPVAAVKARLPSGAAPTSPRSPPPVNCSPSSSTACATGTSARWPRPPRHRPHERQPYKPGAASARDRCLSDTRPGGVVDRT